MKGGLSKSSSDVGVVANSERNAVMNGRCDDAQGNDVRKRQRGGTTAERPVMALIMLILYRSVISHVFISTVQIPSLLYYILGMR